MEKTGKSKGDKPMHYSVGAIIRRGGKLLMIDRNIPPFGFACVAGHIDEGETAEDAVVREVLEESGLKVERCEKIAEEELDWNRCSKGVDAHHWYLFECEVSGQERMNEESKSIGWFSLDEIKKLELEPVWKYWFEKLGVI